MKLYVNGVKAFRELTAAGAKIFAVLYLEVQGESWKRQGVPKFQCNPAGNNTHERGNLHQRDEELVSKEFIAPSVLQGWYFINPDYMWNGDRLAFVKSTALNVTKAAMQGIANS